MEIYIVLYTLFRMLHYNRQAFLPIRDYLLENGSSAQTY